MTGLAVALIELPERRVGWREVFHANPCVMQTGAHRSKAPVHDFVEGHCEGMLTQSHRACYRETSELAGRGAAGNRNIIAPLLQVPRRRPCCRWWLSGTRTAREVSAMLRTPLEIVNRPLPGAGQAPRNPGAPARRLRRPGHGSLDDAPARNASGSLIKAPDAH